MRNYIALALIAASTQAVMLRELSEEATADVREKVGEKAAEFGLELDAADVEDAAGKVAKELDEGADEGDIADAVEKECDKRRKRGGRKGGDDEDGFELIDLEELRRPLGIEQDVLDEKAPQSSYASAVARDRKLNGPLSKLPGGNECAVCQGAMDGLEPVRLLPCRHCFHADCIEPWLKRSTQCPSCRADVSKEE